MLDSMQEMGIWIHVQYPVHAVSSGMARRGFTLIELVTVVAVVAVLAGLLLPAANLIREQSRSSSCQSNLRQIGIAVLGYASEKDGVLPPSYIMDPALGWIRWPTQINPYLMDYASNNLGNQGRSPIKGCPTFLSSTKLSDPSMASWDHFSYGMNELLLRPSSTATSNWSKPNPRFFNQSQITIAPHRLLIGDALESFFVAASTGDYRHRGNAANALFCDGHVGWLSEPEALVSTTNPATLRF